MKRRRPLKKVTFGTCAYGRTSPDQAKLSTDTKILNILIPFEQSLKINLAMDECVRNLNKYSKSTSEGKRAALNFCIHFNQKRISVHEGKL